MGFEWDRFVQRQRVRQISDGKSLGRKGGGMNAIITSPTKYDR